MGGASIVVRIGSLTASPNIIASPVRNIGSIPVRPSKLSDMADVICPLSEALDNLSAKKVPHCESMVGSISDGLWLTVMSRTI